MALAAGTRLGPYEILEPLGAGGMGEVYRATDTKLGRHVALKTLPSDLTGDSQRLARFQREAKLLASLNHPNIAAIHGLEETDGQPFLVLELVEGEDLAERLERGRIRVDEALEIARQIAGALEEAHEKGIVHRDLKPANVKLTPDGKVKVLDFGLAKAWAGDPVSESSSDLSQSPTLAQSGTQAGVILGTAAYMSPEQARGRPVNKRADIWSLGTVLFEMLTGRPLFAGDTASEVLASVIKDEPDWTRLPSTSPPQLRRLLRRCLEKDSRRRLHDVADVRIEIEDLLALGPETGDLEGGAGQARWRGITGRPSFGRVIAALIGVVAAWAVFSPLWMGPSVAPGTAVVSRFVVPTGPLLTDERTPALAISSNGRRIVYSALNGDKERLYLREIESLESIPLENSDGAVGPFFSPDGDNVGFASDGWLRSLPVRGGPANPLKQLTVFLGGDWGENDVLVYGEWPTRHLWQIPASGGTAQPLTEPLADIRYYIEVAPSFILGGNAVVFHNFNAFTVPGEPVGRMHRIGSRAQKVLDVAGSNLHCAPTGHLLFASGGSLSAVLFDEDRGELLGAPVAVLGNVLTNVHGVAQFDVSDTGTLVYLPGPVQLPEHRLVWVDREGASKPVLEESRSFWGPRLSPDGSRIAVWMADDRPGIWTYDLVRGGLSRLTLEGSNFWSLWKPDGSGLAFASRQEDGTGFLAFQLADRSAPAFPLVGENHPAVEQPLSWADDGEVLIFQRGSGEEEGFDIWTASLNGSAAPKPLIRTLANEFQGILSPDGRWLAYVSDESGRREIYVRPYPAADRTFPVSTRGGEEPLWAPSGRELFYRAAGQVMVVELETDPEFRPSKPRPLFEDRFIHGTPYGRNYDIDGSGEYFLMTESTTSGHAATGIVVVQNWYEELKRLVPPD